MTGVRTPGWPDVSESCRHWSPEQHRQVACELLDANFSHGFSEDAYDGEPPHRHYEAKDPDDDASDPPDYAPYLAALTHALLALSTPDPEENRR